jgi:DNA polymerase I
MKLIFDLESNALLDKLDTIHCIVCKDIETQQVYSFNPDNIKEGLELLNKATLLVGHNVQGFDLLALKKVYNYEYKGEILDTLLLSRLIYTNLVDHDYKHKELPAKLYGRHSLEAWGYRLGLRKGDYQEHSDFSEFNQDMLDYCKRDVEVTYLLYNKFIKENYSDKAIILEHDFAHWIRKQEQHGVHFDETTAKSLQSILTKRRLELEDKLALVFPAWEKIVGTKVYKRDNKKRGIRAGVPVTITKQEIFNPNSRQHIADRLIKVLGWKPSKFTATGQPEVNEQILNSLEYPEAKIISEFLMIQKRLGQLSDGDQAYLKLNKKGKIYGQVITNGAITGRCTHHSPNLAQCVSSSSAFGKEFRSLFVAPTDMVMCGIDFSGLELRVLGHYLSVYDNGNFKKTLLEDDIHTANQKATGLPTRSQAKTFIYAFIYGCGDKKLSEILNVTYDEAKRVRARFTNNLPALGILINAVRDKFKTYGFLKGLDGRRLICRAEFSSLNTLIQSAGALLVKKGTIILNQELTKAGFKWGEDYAMVLHVHDEMQFIVKKELVEQFKSIAKTIFNKTKEYFNFKTPLDGEIKIGNNWSETH